MGIETILSLQLGKLPRVVGTIITAKFLEQWSKRPTALPCDVIELRVDGFSWQPKQTLDWMVCDMVEQPRRVAARMAEWFREGWCRQAVFNLKLPMKKRWDETTLCLDLFQQQAQRPLTIRARQLYHDREEITLAAWRV